MDQQRLILESSPIYIIVCAVMALVFAYLLYSVKSPWSKTWNRVLFATRAILAFLLIFLLLGPIVKQINNLFEKPLFIFLHDNSLSVKAALDSVTINNVQQELIGTREALGDLGYEAVASDLAGDEIDQVEFSEVKTDLNSALRKISNRYDGRKIAGVIMTSDGIYNAGSSPLFATYNFPVHTVGLGDTIQRTDVGVRNIAYNKIAYQGNKFPVRVEVLTKNLSDQPVNVSLLQRGKVLEKQTKVVKNNQLLVFEFQPLANEQGIQKLDVQVEVKPGETNTANNRASAFVEVVEGKKKILVIAASPHPDLKALREVVDKNSNYEFILHIPGITEAAVQQPRDIDLVVFHQAPDLKGRTKELFQKYLSSEVSLLFIYGQQTDLRLLSTSPVPFKFETAPRDFDEVTPIGNVSFPNFSISAEAATVIQDYPPVSVHFAKLNVPPTSSILLYQRVGSVATEKPLLVIDNNNNRKLGLMLGEGLWRWRLNEFDRVESTEGFDELFGKVFQYLTTSDDKRKFRSYPVQQEFSEIEPALFESQVYNDLFEPIYGHTIDIELTDEAGAKTNYSYVTSPGSTRYQVGGLKEGVYRFRSRTKINEKPEEVKGEFAVVKRQAELQNLTTDFDLLRKLSSNTGGRFYDSRNINQLQADLQKVKATSVIHTEESYKSLINLKVVFWLLLLIVSLEWFTRKYFGSY